MWKMIFFGNLIMCGCAAVQGFHGGANVGPNGATVKNVPVPPRQLPDVMARATEDRAAEAGARDQHFRTLRYWNSGERSVAWKQMQMCEADHTALRAYCMEHLNDDERCLPVLQMGPVCMERVGAGSRGFGFGYGAGGYAGVVLQRGLPFSRSNWRDPDRGDLDEAVPAWGEEVGGAR